MEKLERNTSDPAYVADSPGMSAEAAKAFAALAGVVTAAKAADPRLAMAQTIASQTGKTVEEVLQFLGTSASTNIPSLPTISSVDAPSIVIEDIVEDIPEEEIKVIKTAKISKEVPSDGFVVTEIVDPSEATEADLAKLSEEEEEQNWDNKIRLGSIVKIIFQVSASRINWVGKRGKVTRIVGNEAAKVYEVEFKGRKVAKVRLNKKTGLLERGFENKPLRNTFSEDQVELAE